MALFDNLKKLGGELLSAGARHRDERASQTNRPPTDAPGAASADMSAPRNWISAARCTEISGLTVTGPEDVQTDETFGVRFTGIGSDASCSIEINALAEEAVGRFGGRPDRWIDDRLAGFSRRVIPTFGDYCVTAHDGSTRSWCYVWVADSAMSVQLDSPRGPDEGICETILRSIYDWPAS